MSQVDLIEKLYQDFKDVAEFRLVYICEAHAIDGRLPMPLKDGNGNQIREHRTYQERCGIAQTLIDEKKLTLPVLIDQMNDNTSRVYYALPDRLFVVQKDGRVAVRADRGPRGLAKALETTRDWLTELRETGAEPHPLSP